MNKEILYNDSYSKNVYNNFGKKSYRYCVRLKQLLKLIKINPTDKVLEIGANNGDLTKEIMKYSSNVIGVDLNIDAVKIANSDNILLMNAENLKFPDKYFNKIVSIHTIEHIPDIKKVFCEIDRVLGDNGEAVLFYPLELIRGIAAVRDAVAVHKNILAARKLHIHKLNPSKIKKLVKGTNLKIKESGIYFEIYPAFYTVLTKDSSLRSKN